MRNTSIGHDGVERAGGVFRCLDHGIHIDSVGDVEAMKLRRAARCLNGANGFLAFPVKNIGDIDVIPGRREGEGRAMADTNTGTGYEDSSFARVFIPFASNAFSARHFSVPCGTKYAREYGVGMLKIGRWVKTSSQLRAA